MGAKQSDVAWRNSFQMMSMGLQYKLTPNMTIGADFRMIQSNNPYNYLYYNSYGNIYANPYSNF
jgi:opacity protein-like surface antigen